MEKFPQPLIYKESLKSYPISVEEVMEDVQRDISILLDKLKEQIDRHDYQMIIGIDGGGRVPALILSKVLKGIYNHDEIEPPYTRFITGSRHSENRASKQAMLREYFSEDIFQDIKEQGGKVLIVEDVIVTGESIREICDVLDEAGVGYDVVSLARSMIATSSGNSSGSSLYGNKIMQGVHKDPDELFSRPLRKPLEKKKSKKNNIPSASQYGGPEISQVDEALYPIDADVLKRTRELSGSISTRLIEDYLKKRKVSLNKV